MFGKTRSCGAEVRTWAYGRKVLAIRVAYLLLVALSAIALRSAISGGLAGPGRFTLGAGSESWCSA